MNHFTKHKEECFTLENFLTEEECKKIIRYLEFLANSGINQWNQISFYESYAMGYWGTQYPPDDPRYGKDDNLKLFGLEPDYFFKLKDKIKAVSEEALGIELSEVSYHAQKWTEGAFASWHSDNSDEDGNPTAFERSKYAVFLYLNEDFEGGKLNFLHHDVTISPKVGLIAIFNGGHTNEHEVTKVLSGTRYTIGSFWDRADSVYTDEQRARWAEELSKVRSEQDELYKVWAEDRERGIIPDYKGKNE